MSKPESALHRVPPYRRPIVVIGFLVVLVVVIIATIFICKNLNLDTNSQHLPEDSNPSADQPAGNDNPIPEPEDKTPAYEGGSPNELDELTGVIAYADIDPETQALHSAITINQYLHSDGQCVFNLKRGEVIYRTASAPATSDVTTSVCGPFTLSIADLSPGEYQIEVILTGDDKRGVITQNITL